MKLKGKASGEGWEVWKARLKASGLFFNRLRRERKEYEDALALADGLHGWSSFDSISDALDNSHYHQQSVPFSFRYAVWLQARTTGRPPVLKYPRDGEDDPTLIPTVESLLLRIATEAGMFREWKSGIFDLCGFGSYCLWFGFHAEVTLPDETEGAKDGAQETVARALRGDTEVKPAQDNAAMARALDAQLTDPVNQLVLPPDAQMGLAVAASGHDQKAVEAIGEPRPVNVKQRTIWCRRLPVGIRVRWDHTVTERRDMRWVARRVEMRMEEARQFEGFGPGVRQRLVPFMPSDSDPVEPVRDNEDKPMEGDENARFVFWEVFDRFYRTRHYISEQMEGYLERDESYPYPDSQTGEPALPGFFPCVISAPLQHSAETPERTAGLPLIAPGYPLQRLIVDFHDWATDSAKRHCVRQFEIPEGLPDDVKELLQSGQDGGLVERPAGVDPGQLVQPIVFSGEAFKIVELIENLTDRWCAIQGMPRTDLTGQPQAKTATAEGLSVQAGRNQADFVFRCIEEDMASGIEIIRAMVRIGLYPPEKLAGLVGKKGAAFINAWKPTSLDGDALILSLADRAESEKMARIKQLGEALLLVSQFRDPETNLLKYNASPIVEEILMSLDIGRVPQIQYPPEVVMQAKINTLMGGMGMGQPGQPGQGGEGGKDGGQNQPPRDKGGPDKREREQGPPTEAHMNGAAQRG